MQRDSNSTKFPLGATIPNFELPSTDDTLVNNSYFTGAKAALVVFTCNHCPYVKGSEEMLIAIVKKYAAVGLKAITISSNDAVKYPDDNFLNMKIKAKELQLPYPYLYDETQSVAKMFDAACTPECYLFDCNLKLAYHGTINDNPKDKRNVAKDFLTPAIESVLAGALPTPQYIHPIGCSIKWK